jgi:hypothetical protein
MKKNVKIAKKLVKLAKSLVADENFNFVTTNDCGPDNTIEVAKSDVFAHQITEDDVSKIQDMESREGQYDDSYKVAGNWICTAKVGADAGEFWIVKEAKFGKNYETKVADGETLKKKVCGVEFTFEHHLAAGGATFQCFRLPKDAPAHMEFGGQKFVPGDYVFIENGECDIWARADKFMQQQYHKVADGKKPPKKVYDQYEEIINSGK